MQLLGLHRASARGCTGLGTPRGRRLAPPHGRGTTAYPPLAHDGKILAPGCILDVQELVVRDGVGRPTPLLLLYPRPLLPVFIAPVVRRQLMPAASTRVLRERVGTCGMHHPQQQGCRARHAAGPWARPPAAQPPARRAAVVVGQPRRQARRVEHVAARHHLHLIPHRQLIPAGQPGKRAVRDRQSAKAGRLGGSHSRRA